MSLPKLSSPTYSLILESSGQEITYRPFLVKEEKILLMAMESDEDNDMLRATKQIINNCVQEEIDIDSLPMFDMEYIFLNLRSKSVGETSEVGYSCPDCQAVNQITIPLDEVKVKKDENHKAEIELTSDVGLIMKYPQMNMMEDITGDTEDVDNIFKIIENCVDCIYDNENTYNLNDYTEDERTEFFDSLTQNQFNEVREFFDTMPKLAHDIDYNCSECSHNETITVEGLQNFFA
jgi:hypothetical protein